MVCEGGDGIVFIIVKVDIACIQRQTHMLQPIDVGGLAVQSLETLDVNALTPLTPEIISRQASINFGTIGHVAHGKSTVVRAISGVHTVRFKNEKERNITIKLGYANAKIYRCSNPDCPPPACYWSGGSTTPDHPPCQVPDCGHTMKLERHVSFVDCPGHEILMATMLNGAAVMDAALLLIAGNETCPQAQTLEHLAAVEILNLRHLIILQNKVELVKPETALTQYEEIKKFVTGTVAEHAPIIPISAVLKFNIDYICQSICTHIPVPVRDFTAPPHMIILRSFDVNKPGEGAETLKGGVAGGSLITGVLRLGDEIEIRPGIIQSDDQGNTVGIPIRTQIVSLLAEANQLQYAIPGGLIGVGTKIDPSLTRADRLVGQVIGYPGQLPKSFSKMRFTYNLLNELLGVKSKADAKRKKVGDLKDKEWLLVNIGSTSVTGKVSKVQDRTAYIKLHSPACAPEGANIALSRKIDKHFRLIGWGNIMKTS
eukprot:GHVO01039624.1.p1 GENE.GHVO01039624.1~~GHVO01039624.1.p1  ORF type:complete len:485 (+),score=90.68 GHVO01039624.1:1339-2793(+)